MDQAKQALKDSTLEVELWAGKSDLLLRQVKVHFNLNMKNIPDQPGASALIDLTLQEHGQQDQPAGDDHRAASKPAGWPPTDRMCTTSRRDFACGRLLFVIRMARPVTLTRLVPA